MKPEPDSVTVTYRWGVCAADEPVGIRTIKGYVTVLEHQTPSGAPINYHVIFSDLNGQMISNFGVEDFTLFASAAGLVMEELGLPVLGSPSPVAVLVPISE